MAITQQNGRRRDVDNSGSAHVITDAKSGHTGVTAVKPGDAFFARTDVQSRKIIVMAGHEAGILTFGKDLEEAFAVLMREREKFTHE